MTTAATSLLGLALPVTGELSGTWGDTVNNSITSLLDTAIAGTTTLSTDGDVTLSTTTLAANQARQAILLCSGARTAIRTITAPAQSKIYTIINATTGGYAVKLVGVGPTTGLTIPNGASAVVAWNGSDFIEIGSSTIGNLTVNGNLTVTGTSTLTGAATLTANPTLSAGTANGVAYLNGSKVVTTGSALTFDGTNLGVGLTPSGSFRLEIGGADGTQFAIRSTGTTSARIRGYVNSAESGVIGFLNGGGQYFEVAGSEAMRLTSTGLGIGTSSPVAKLDVSGGFIRVNEDGAGTKVLTIRSNWAGVDPAINVTTNNNLLFMTNNTERMRLDTSGNLGIGTSSPGAKLDVQGTSGVIRLKQSSSGSATYYLMDNTVETGGKIWRFGYTGASGIPTFSLYNQTDNVLAWVADSSGNLGLGVTPSAWSPQKAMQIASYTALADNPQGGGGFGLSSNAYEYSSGAYKYLQSYYAALYRTYAGQHQWLTAPSGTAGNAITFTQAMTLDASGRLGVGATSPNENLTINSANASNARIGLQYNGSALTYFGSYSGIVGSGNATDTMLAATGILAFGAGGTTERARIDSSGNLLVGTTATINAAKSVISFTSSSNGLYLQDSTGVSGAQFMRFDSASSTCGSITRVAATSAVTYNTTSDYRLKNLVGEVTGSGERIDALKPVEFDWIEGNKRSRGFFAHEFQSVYEDSVSGEKDAVDSDGNPVYQSMQASTAEVIADLVAELQSLRKRVAQLEGAK